jgi:hypothetical protein
MSKSAARILQTQGGEFVVVAVAQFLDRDGVVFVDYGHGIIEGEQSL